MTRDLVLGDVALAGVRRGEGRQLGARLPVPPQVLKVVDDVFRVDLGID